ncbi:hypothetical protein [Actinoplanes sp. NBRC 101535]|uniref:hypothetical protein n=1 Tax=Actinoplanes sp. NBRC 101535 TaxID=3032196 RepID=UPI0024A0515E|nr:hypothetical protein [Actinoplanes sp. NBRC 101535]GLY02376.1 hypothetical protein Acsp01_27550 [Actinoplanes sp. NBRC 101535]
MDLGIDSVVLHGKGGKQRRVRLGPQTARILRRYIRSRNRRTGIDDVPQLWIALKGARRLRAAGIKIRLKRLGEKAGITNLFAHRWRHR